MEYVINIDVVDILTRDHIDLFVPIPVEWAQLKELITLLCRECIKIVEYDRSVLQLEWI